jgi:hypothetical protein
VNTPSSSPPPDVGSVAIVSTASTPPPHPSRVKGLTLSNGLVHCLVEAAVMIRTNGTVQSTGSAAVIKGRSTRVDVFAE